MPYKATSEEKKSKEGSDPRQYLGIVSYSARSSLLKNTSEVFLMLANAGVYKLNPDHPVVQRIAEGLGITPERHEEGRGPSTFGFAVVAAVLACHLDPELDPTAVGLDEGEFERVTEVVRKWCVIAKRAGLAKPKSSKRSK